MQMNKFCVPIPNSLNNTQTFENYVFSPEKRPGNIPVHTTNTIPVIDLHFDDRATIIQQVLEASEEYGFFQVINHGVPKKLIDNTMSVVEEFFALPLEEKMRESSKDPEKRCKFYHSSLNYNNEKIHLWRDAFSHPCNPLEEHTKFWPEKPSRYREIVEIYTIELRKLSSKIMELISEGLKLEKDYFDHGGLIESPLMLNNHYPPCPDPSLTLGISKHRDATLITILLQGDVHGLQVLKDGQWISIDPIPHVFVINTGYLLQIISNGKLKGAEHRVVTNSKVARTSISFQVVPHGNCMIQPTKALINAENLPRYRALTFKDFRTYFDFTNADDEALEEFISHNYSNLDN